MMVLLSGLNQTFRSGRKRLSATVPILTHGYFGDSDIKSIEIAILHYENRFYNRNFSLDNFRFRINFTE